MRLLKKIYLNILIFLLNKHPDVAFVDITLSMDLEKMEVGLNG